jgi:hypothetical protein
MMLPMYSAGRITLIRTHGSRISVSSSRRGMRAGRSTTCTVPSVRTASYVTFGAVWMIGMLFSRSSRYWMISMCSSPRNPHRKPNPSASEVSISNTNEESFSESFSSAVRSVGRSSFSCGKSPQ